MTTTEIPNTAERARRIADLWTRRPSWSEPEICAEVDADLAVEAGEIAERQRWGQEMAAAMRRRWTCICCGVGNSLYARDGLCDACRPVVAQLEAERRATELVNGRPRRAWATALLERRERKAG